jgi:hypothetical protein
MARGWKWEAKKEPVNRQEETSKSKLQKNFKLQGPKFKGGLALVLA